MNYQTASNAEEKNEDVHLRQIVSRAEFASPPKGRSARTLQSPTRSTRIFQFRNRSFSPAALQEMKAKRQLTRRRNRRTRSRSPTDQSETSKTTNEQTTLPPKSTFNEKRSTRRSPLPARHFIHGKLPPTPHFNDRV